MAEKKAGPVPDPELSGRAEAIARKQKTQTAERYENLSAEAVAALEQLGGRQAPR